MLVEGKRGLAEREGRGGKGRGCLSPSLCLSLSFSPLLYSPSSSLALFSSFLYLPPRHQSSLTLLPHLSHFFPLSFPLIPVSAFSFILCRPYPVFLSLPGFLSVFSPSLSPSSLFLPVLSPSIPFFCPSHSFLQS